MANIKKYVSNRRCFGGLVFFLAAAVAPIASLAQTRDVTLTPDQLPGLTIMLPGAGEFQVPVTATGPGGSVTRTMRVLVVQAAPPPSLTVRDVEGPVGEPIPLTITATDADTVTITIPDGATLSTETTTPPSTDSIQGMLDAAGAVGTVTIPAGTYFGQTILPLDGQTILATGVVMDGQGTVRYAIPSTFSLFSLSQNAPASTSVHGVTITGLTFTNYKSPAQGNGGVIDGRGNLNWTLIDVNVVANAGVGVELGAGWHLINGLYADNGTIAISGGDGGLVTIEGIECRNNNTTHQRGESGCMKIWRSSSVIRGICSWGNWGPGIWFDGGAGPRLHLVEDNLIFDNASAGIEIELQLGGVVRRNTVVRNGHPHTWGGGSGIQIQNSQGFSVHDNYVEVGVNMFGTIGNSIFTINQERGTLTKDNDIFDNEIVFLVDGAGMQGTVQDFDPDDDQFITNTWHDNTIVRPGETPVQHGGWYAWTNRDHTWEGVQARAGEVISQFIVEQRQPTQVQCPSP